MRFDTTTVLAAHTVDGDCQGSTHRILFRRTAVNKFAQARNCHSIYYYDNLLVLPAEPRFCGFANPQNH